MPNATAWYWSFSIARCRVLVRGGGQPQVQEIHLVAGGAGGGSHAQRAQRRHRVGRALSIRCYQ